MRKLFAVVMIAALFVAVACSISSSPAETGAPYALEAETAQPGVAEAEQFACASCSHAVPYLGAETEVVREPSTAFENARGARSFANDNVECKNLRENAIASTVGTILKLPSVAAVNSKVRDVSSAARVEVEVLAVGV